jgi:hypothetical protein
MTRLVVGAFIAGVGLALGAFVGAYLALIVVTA